jgi:hypothetical protein
MPSKLDRKRGALGFFLPGLGYKMPTRNLPRDPPRAQDWPDIRNVNFAASFFNPVPSNQFDNWHNVYQTFFC